MNLLNKLFRVFTKGERVKIFLLQIFIVFVSFMEVVGFSALAPFLAFIGTPEVIETNKYSSFLYKFLNFNSHMEFIIFWGVMTAVLILVSNLLIMAREYLCANASFRLYRSLGMRMIRYYLKQDYLFHAERNSNRLISNYGQLSMVLNSMLIPVVTGVGRICVILFFLIGIVWVDPLLGLVLNLGIGTLYVALFLLFRRINIRASKVIAGNEQDRIKLLSESFRGIKDILIAHLSPVFSRRLKKLLSETVKNMSRQQLILIAPKYLVEGVLFGALTLLILFMYNKQGDDFVSIISKLSFVAVAGYKMMPKLSELYNMISRLQGGIGSLDLIHEDLYAAKSYINDEILRHGTEDIEPATFEKKITLKDISFSYKEGIPVLKNVTVEFEKNKTVGLVGTTGTGKTTLVNILLGLIKPNGGKLIIDGKEIPWEDVGSLQKLLGYVPQDIFLLDDTIEKNVAFGLRDEEIDKDRVKEILKLASLWEHVEQMPQGVNTIIGEAGVQLSGGQRQRLGIARTLYRGAEILVFDEATSSLDSNTEKQIMKAINDISHKRTVVIIAHRINTLKNADSIVVLKDGFVDEVGTYEELLKTNDNFMKLAGVEKESEIE